MTNGKNLPEVDTSQWETVYADPDGPEVQVPYLGTTRTFRREGRELLAGQKTYSLPFLMHHVPLDMRGPYKIPSTMNEGKRGLLGERVGPAAYAMCMGIVKGKQSSDGSHEQRNVGQRNNGEDRPCKAKAINRSGLCSRHGGMLNPQDRRRIIWENAPREIRFKYGHLPVEELDDEELSRGQLRRADGTWTDNNSVSTEIHDAMVKRLFERADEQLKKNLLDCVNSITDIAKGTAYEPADRLKAATWVFERLRGKVPTEVIVSQDKPFEMIVTDMMTGGSRAESRARRGEPELEDAVDAEVVDEFLADLDEGQDEDVIEDNEVVPVDDGPPEDHVPLRADFVPEVPVVVGAAGRPEPSPLPPHDMDQRARWLKEKARLDAEAQARQQAFLDEASAYRKAMAQAKRTRMYHQRQGRENVPVAYTMEVFDEPNGEITIELRPPT